MSYIIEPSADVDEVAGVLRAALPSESISPSRFVRQVVLDPNFDLVGSFLARASDGFPIGYALAMARKVPIEGVMPDPERGYITLLGVAPDARGRGVATGLLERCEGYLKDQGKKVCLISSYSPGYFAPGVDVDEYAEGLTFLKRRGYAEVYRPIAMEASLWNLQAPEFATVDDGVRIVRDVHSLDFVSLLQFVRDEFGADWVRFVRESALRQLDGDLRTGLTVAFDGDRPIGFGHFDSERFGPIGVAAKERGRRVGIRLMFDVLAMQRDRGFRTSWFLWSDDRTADRLYRHAAFRIVRRYALLKKEIG